ncbi:MAG TPA: hypothetical protein VF161_06770 [Steroidobacteraceae bacterium]
MSRYDYATMPRRQLAALMRQARRNSGEYACEFGHVGCGCTNSRNMSGLAACSEAVAAEIVRRNGCDCKRPEPVNGVALVSNGSAS